MELNFRKDPSILGNVVDAMADGLFTVDAGGRIVAWSLGAERITGYAGSEVVGRSCRIFEGPDCKGFATLSELLDGTCRTRDGTCEQECKLFAKDGRELYLHGRMRVVAGSDGRVAGAVVTFSDLTEFLRANERIALLEEQTKSRDAIDKIVGRGAAMREVFRRIRLATAGDVTVFLSGDTGTGKELAARAIHSLSARKDRPFLAVNCSAIPESLLESVLFGHVKGAFTGATRDQIGVFEEADGGTLFLDEIGDTTPLTQLKLLRALQEREVQRVGDSHARRVNVRLVTATNKDLRAMVAASLFREDFFYRIHVFAIEMPRLRDRREDIPLLTQSFIDQLANEYHKPVKGIARDALQRLVDHDWPGNVRELRNALEHAFVLVEGETITLLDLPVELRSPAPAALDVDAAPNSTAARLSSDEMHERGRILDALAQARGNKTQAAKLLGTSRVTLWKKLRKFRLDTPDRRRRSANLTS